MTNEKLETGIEAIKAMLPARDAGSQANVIGAVPESLALPAPWSAKRMKRKSDETDVGQSVGSDAHGGRRIPNQNDDGAQPGTMRG
jgi:hypothetical protein